MYNKIRLKLCRLWKQISSFLLMMTQKNAPDMWGTHSPLSEKHKGRDAARPSGEESVQIKCIWVYFPFIWLLDLPAKMKRNHCPKTSLLNRWPLSLLFQRCPRQLSIKGTGIMVIVKVLTYSKLLMLNSYVMLLKMNDYILDRSVGISQALWTWHCLFSCSLCLQLCSACLWQAWGLRFTVPRALLMCFQCTRSW